VKKFYAASLNQFWSPGYFSSTVDIDEIIIKRYEEFQEKMNEGQL
jgi:hypothetical protein